MQVLLQQSASSQAGRKSSKRRRKNMVIRSDDEEDQEEESQGDGEEKQENLKLIIKPRVHFAPSTLSTPPATQESFSPMFDRRMEDIIKALDRNTAAVNRMGDIVTALDRNTTAVNRMRVDFKDLSGHLDESFEVLRTLGTALANRALNEDDDTRRNKSTIDGQ